MVVKSKGIPPQNALNSRLKIIVTCPDNVHLFGQQKKHQGEFRPTEPSGAESEVFFSRKDLGLQIQPVNSINGTLKSMWAMNNTLVV